LALIDTAVPGDSAPAKLAGLGAPPVTLIVKSEAALVPPLLLITCLITVNVAGWSSFVIVQVADPPGARPEALEHPAESERV
jgi:hypothetical protein